ncbi:hypothetical protein [Curtobacterium sp. MCBD17_008]|uniref:hypothetical protein n=1 Tax=Curtobacterium sp. MCBD17_008 TaxID=2175656 RepID=UPI0011B79257|nr:hypothetical protein [Curtobacterium sp. MCBD17_008]
MNPWGLDEWLTELWRGEEPLDGLIQEEGFRAADEIRRRLEEMLEDDPFLAVDNLYALPFDCPTRVDFEREAFAAVGDHLWWEFDGYHLTPELAARLLGVTVDRAAELLDARTPTSEEALLMEVTMDAVDEYLRRDPRGDPLAWLMSATSGSLLVADQIATWSGESFDELARSLPPRP